MGVAVGVCVCVFTGVWEGGTAPGACVHEEGQHSTCAVLLDYCTLCIMEINQPSNVEVTSALTGDENFFPGESTAALQVCNTLVLPASAQLAQSFMSFVLSSKDFYGAVCVWHLRG